MPYDDNSQTLYHHLNLRKLFEPIDCKKIGRANIFYAPSLVTIYGINIPEDIIRALLRIGYEEYWVDSHVEEVRRYLTVQGEMDELFEKVCEFVRTE
jgi:hypothetical protein